MTTLLDTRTIIILLLVSAILMGLVLWLSPRSEKDQGLSYWITGLMIIAVGWALIAMRGHVQPVLSIALANAIMLTGLVTLLCGLIKFGTGKTPSHWLPPLTGLFLFTALLPFRFDFEMYTLLASTAYSVAVIVLAGFSFHYCEGKTRWAMMFFFALAAVMLMLRAFAIVLQPGVRTGLLGQDTLTNLTLLAQFAMTITASFGFLDMRRHRAEMQIRHLAMFDGLTDLLNRRAFLDMAEREQARARRSGLPFTVFMMDIDRFKRVNDTLGHAAGDRVLASVAAAARNSLRKEDQLSRYGGEEFCVLLPETDREKSMAVAERIRSAVEQMSIADIPLPITISIGVATCSDPASETIDAVINRADEAMYEAKETGRNRVVASRQ